LLDFDRARPMKSIRGQFAPELSLATAILIGVVFLSGKSAPSIPATEDRPRETPLVLRGTTLIDGTGSPPLPNSAVLIRGDRILGVGKRTSSRYQTMHACSTCPEST
jgi:hypothetical protein